MRACGELARRACGPSARASRGPAAGRRRAPRRRRRGCRRPSWPRRPRPPSRPSPSGSKQRTGSASRRSTSSGVGSGGALGHAGGADGEGVGDEADAVGCSRKRAAISPRATRAAVSRARGALEHRARVLVAVLLHADEVGVAGARTGQRLVARDLLLRVDVVGRGIRLVADGLGAHHGRPTSATRCCRCAARRASPGSARGGGRRGTRPRPARTSSAPRGRSRGAGGTGRPARSFAPTSTPAGRPSIMATSAGPCDSPAVNQRSMPRSSHAVPPCPRPARSAGPPASVGAGGLRQSSGRTCTTREMSRPSSIHGPKAMSSLREPRRRTRRTSP